MLHRVHGRQTALVAHSSPVKHAIQGLSKMGGQRQVLGPEIVQLGSEFIVWYRYHQSRRHP